MLAFDDVIEKRRSVRGFSARPVPLDVLREALQLAQRSPSNCNAQPWRVVVATGPARDRLANALTEAHLAGEPPWEDPTPRFEGTYRARQVACAAELYGKMGIAREDRAGRQRAELRNFEFFDAPCIAIVSMDERFGIGVALDVGCWLQTFMLALAARGIGSCAQASLRRYPEVIRRELGLDPGLRILCGVSFGYEEPSVAANRAVMDRAAIEECVTLVGF